MITPDRIREMVKKFDRVLPYAEKKGSFDMGESWVSHHRGNDESSFEHKCGTVHCLGGWRVLAEYWDLKSSHLDDKNWQYCDGAWMIACDVGIYNKMKLKEWAGKNPKVWGNAHGAVMFGCSRAYDDAETLKEVLDWWLRVADRLKEHLLCGTDKVEIYADEYLKEIRNEPIEER